MRFFLIGFMGVGKSTLGQMVAEELGMPFVDLDEWIEEKTEMSIKAVFEEYGEPFFRKMEHDCLREVVSLHDRFVMATGGGLPCHSTNMEFMGQHGFTIYLKAPSPDIAHRLASSHGKRPVLDRMDRDELEQHIAKLLDQREVYYGNANAIIELDMEGDKSENVSKIIKVCRAQD